MQQWLFHSVCAVLLELPSSKERHSKYEEKPFFLICTLKGERMCIIVYFPVSLWHRLKRFEIQGSSPSPSLGIIVNLKIQCVIHFLAGNHASLLVHCIFYFWWNFLAVLFRDVYKYFKQNNHSNKQFLLVPIPGFQSS